MDVFWTQLIGGKGVGFSNLESRDGDLDRELDFEKDNALLS